MIEITRKKSTYSKELYVGRQNKHITGIKGYISSSEARTRCGWGPASEITIHSDEVQIIIDRYSGKGIVDSTRDGKARSVEYLSTNQILGIYYKDGVPYETRKAAIHYCKDSAHFVPDEGKGYD
ncbi:MAG: hypothetical protein GX260_03560 [Tissierellia bacterium]|nr:polymorphic toxin type 50 domain-containing protein [Bacillota bacterium]NLL22839.1 hypothetical protein [Tissierellia bacterium]